MKNTSFIGPFVLIWAILLIAGSYYAFFNKLTLESIVLRYGKILFNFEVDAMYWVDISRFGDWLHHFSQLLILMDE